MSYWLHNIVTVLHATELFTFLKLMINFMLCYFYLNNKNGIATCQLQDKFW